MSLHHSTLHHPLIALLAALLCAALGLSSCSDVASDERLIYVEPATTARRVLIEDFTGQRCKMCTNATNAIADLQQIYGTDVVAVAIHCGPYGFAGNATTRGLMTDLGREYWNTWFTNSQGQPVAKINRGPATDDYDNWSEAVRTQISRQTDVQITATATIDSALQAHITLQTLATAGRKAHLQVWLTQDSIIALQTMPNGATNRQYVHNHVLRSAVNGTWGQPITYTEAPISLTYTTPLPPDCPPEHLNAVIFVYDDKEGVLQVLQQPFTHHSSTDQ